MAFSRGFWLLVERSGGEKWRGGRRQRGEGMVRVESPGRTAAAAAAHDVDDDDDDDV